MNGPFQVAQASGAEIANTNTAPRIFRLTKPLGDQAVVINLGYDQNVKVDLSGIANEKITLVHVGEKLIVLFDNKSTITVEPFFDSRHDALNNLSIEVAPGREVSVNEFASLFPITTDQSVLPAAGDGAGNAQASGAYFSDSSVDPLPGNTPLELLGQEELGNFAVGGERFLTVPAPTIVVIGAKELVVDESFIPGAGSQRAPAGSNVQTVNFADVFQSSGGVTTYALHIDNAATSLVDSQTGQPVTLLQNGNGEVDGIVTVGNQQFTVFTLTLDAAGHLTFTELRAVHESDPNNFNEGTTLGAGRISLVATVTDGFGHTASASLDLGPHMTILDDGPSIEVAGRGEGEGAPSLSVDESFLTTDTNYVDGTSAPHPHVPVTDTADFSAAFTWVEGADGATVTYALGVKVTQGGESGLIDPDSGLIDSETGQHVYLHLVGDNKIEGRVNGDPNTLAFTIELDTQTGHVTLTDLRAVHELTPGDMNEPISLDSVENLVTLTATITDKDLDTDSATIDLGAKITFRDDGPSIDVAGQGEGEGRRLSLSVDESFLTTDTNYVDGTSAPHPHVPVTDTADFSAAFTWVEGADGATVTYALGVKLTQGGESGLIDPDSGLIDSETGQHVYLHLVGDNKIEGRVNGDPNTLAFTIELDTQTGHVTLTDLRAVHELTPGDMNEPISLDSVENLVTLTATITDKDLDTDSATIDLGAKITFYDDGPTLAVTAPAAIHGLDFGSFVLNNNAWGTGSGVATGTNGGWTINDANAGHQPGDQIGNTGGGAVQLERVGDGYEGMHSSTHGFMVDLDASPRDLKISQTVTGLVDGQTYDLRFEAGAPFPNSAHLEVWFGGVRVGNISPTGQMQEYMITLTGGSGDHSNLLEFRETGTPDNQGTYLANVSVGTIVIDETPNFQADSNEVGPNSLFDAIVHGIDPNMPAQFATGTAPVVTVAANFGADGPAAGGGIAYSLFTTNDTDSGLTTTAGQAIHLFNESYDGVHFVVGRYDSDGVNGITSADNAAFAFTVDPTTGALSLVQYASLHHPNTSSNDEGIFLNTGSLSVTVTITDRDDDTATQSADISANIRFDDDGPEAVLAIAPKSGLTIDETAGQDAGTDDVSNIASFAALFNAIPGTPIEIAHSQTAVVSAAGSDYGADGQQGAAPVFALNVSAPNGVDSGLDATDGRSVFLFREGDLIVGREGTPGDTPDANGSVAFAISLDSSTGELTVAQYIALYHENSLDPNESATPLTISNNAIQATVTITDGDGDTSVASVGIGGQIHFLDDGPKIAAAPLDQIVNGDFSQGGVWSAPDWWGSASTNVAGWTLAQSPVEPGTVDLERVAPDLYGMFSSTHGPMVDLGSSPGNIEITQTFGAGGGAGALVNGQTYAIQFEAGAPFPGTAKLEVLWDGQVIGTIDPSGPGALTSYNYIVTANGTSDQLTFREIGTGNAPIPGDYLGHGFETEGYHGTYLANVKLVATYVVDEDGLPGSLSLPAGNHDLPAPSQGDAPGLDTSVNGLLGISWGADNYDPSTPDVDTDRFYQDNNGGVLTGRHVVFTDANIGVSGGKDSHSLTSHGDAVVLSLSSDGTVLVGTATGASGTRTVFEVSLSDDGTGAFKFTLKDALDHAPNGSENDINLTFNFTAVDSDGDAAKGTFTVGVDDDVPVSNGLALRGMTVDEDGLHSGLSDSNPDAHRPGEVTGTNSAVAIGAPGTLTALVNFGADGLGSFGLKTVANPVDSGLTSNGGHILIVTDANGLHGYVDNGTPGFGAGDREVFTLTVGADGSYQFTLKDQIDHPTLDHQQVGDNTENTLSIDLSSYVVATDGDGDSVSLGTGSFTVTVLDDIPVITARDPGSTTVVTTETITYTLQAGNTDFRGMDGQGDHDILLTGVDLNDNDDSVNTTGTKIGIGDGQRIDGYEESGKKLSGPEILTMQFVNSVSSNGNHGSAYDVSSASFSIDVAEAHQINTAVVFVSATHNGSFVALTFTVDGSPVSATAVFQNGTQVGYVLDDVPDLKTVQVTGATGFNVLNVGNYNNYQFDDTAGGGHHQTLTDGNPFKVFGVESTITTTTVVTETFNVSEDESAGVNTAADPNAANDVNPLVDVPPAAIKEAGAIGYAKSPTSVLAPGSLFAGSVGADETGSYSFAITDSHGNPISPVDSGLKTLDGTHIMLSTDANGAVVGTANQTEVFKVYVDGNGFVWIAQYQPIAHDVDGSSQAAFDDIATVTADLHIKATLTDFDGDSTSAVSGVALKIQFQDDGPVAVNDVDSVNGAALTATGNVITGTDIAVGFDANSTDGNADTKGTDGAKITQVAGVTTNTTPDGSHNFQVTGQFGTLVINENGGYTYTRFNGAPAEGNDVFTYTLTDGDGDFSTAKLTVKISDHGVTIKDIGSQGGDETVFENDLSAIRGVGESDGSSPNAPNLTKFGTFNFSAPDGVDDVSIGGTLVVHDGGVVNLNTPIATTYGVLTITGVNLGTGTVSYTYQLVDNTLAHGPGNNLDNSVFDNIPVQVTDVDGDAAGSSLIVKVVDDVPTAHMEPALTVVETDGVTAGTNLLANDTQGADGATVTAVDIGNGFQTIAPSGTTILTNAFGTYAFQADGTWSFDPNANLNNASGISAGFTYKITDGDGDTSTATQAITINDGAAAPTPAAITLDLNEAALSTAGATGSNQGLTTETDNTPALSFTAGSDNLTSFAFSGTGGLVTDLNGTGGQDIFWQLVSGTQIKGFLDSGHTQLAVTLDLNAPASIAAGASGNVTVTATLSDNLQHVLANGAQISSIGSVGVVATDTDGDQTTGTVNINVQDDVPTAVGETIGTPITGAFTTDDLLANDIFGADGVDRDNSPVAGQVTATNGGHGTVVYNNNGTFTYTPNAGYNGPDSFTYTIKDGDGDTSTATVTLNVHTTTPMRQASDYTGLVEEEQLGHVTPTPIYASSYTGNEDTTAGNPPGIPDNDLDTTSSGANSLITTQTANLSTNVQGGTGPYTYHFAGNLEGTQAHFTDAPVGMTSHGKNVLLHVNGDTLTGYTNVGASGYAEGQDHVVFTLKINNASTGATTFTLYDNVDHHTVGDQLEGTRSLNLNGLIEVTDSSSTPQTLALNGSIGIIDDIPVANGDTKSVPEGGGSGGKTDLVLIVDCSNSMDTVVPNTGGKSRLTLAREALTELVNNSTVDEVKFVLFHGNAESTLWMTKAQALTYIGNASNFDALGSGTNYDAALFNNNSGTDKGAVHAFDTPPSSANQRVIYFLSDGEPTDPNSSVGINSTEEANWITFLQSNNVEKVIAVGVGDLNATNAGRLEPIAWSSTETQASSITPPANDPNVLIIDDTDFTQLGATLSATLPNSLSGNVVTESTNGAIADGFGADGPGAGAGILSITVNGHVYAYDVAANKVTKDGNAFSNGGTLDVDTTLGGHLTFHFTTGSGFNAGDYGYTAPANVNSNQIETFHYVIADGDGDKAEADLKITVQNLNEAPTIMSGAAVSVAENTPNTTVVHDAAATDPDGDTITYSLSPGGDNAKFTIDSSTGEVRFKTSPNYEAPGDAGGNNVYDITVHADDGHGHDVTKSVAITVTDLNESAPNITSGATGTVAENSSTSTLVYDAAATDQDGDTVTYSLDAGGDNSLFNINSSNGQVMFKASPNYEAPGDAGGNNVYDIVVHANDGHGHDVTKAVAITVTNVNEVVAVDDIVRTNFDGVAFDVPEWAFLANDKDPEGNSLDISGESGNNGLAVDHTAGSGTNGFITIEDGKKADGGSFAYTATDGSATDQASVTVYNKNNGGDLTGDDSSEIFVGDGNGDTFTANGGNDIILAGGGTDTVYGGNGDDIIVGGSGSDTLWGNAGADHFRYTATGDGGANFSQAGADLIKDFNMAEGDVIEISASAFGGGLVAGNDATGIFNSSANNNFGANERLHFNTATHTLLYDSNGSGAAGTQIALAVLENATVDAAHIKIVA